MAVKSAAMKNAIVGLNLCVKDVCGLKLACSDYACRRSNTFTIYLSLTLKKLFIYINRLTRTVVINLKCIIFVLFLIKEIMYGI